MAIRYPGAQRCIVLSPPRDAATPPILCCHRNALVGLNLAVANPRTHGLVVLAVSSSTAWTPGAAEIAQFGKQLGRRVAGVGTADCVVDAKSRFVATTGPAMRMSA